MTFTQRKIKLWRWPTRRNICLFLDSLSVEIIAYTVPLVNGEFHPIVIIQYWIIFSHFFPEILQNWILPSKCWTSRQTLVYLGMDGLDVLLMASIRKDKEILKDNNSLGSFFLLSYSDLCLEVSVPRNFGSLSLYCEQCLQCLRSTTSDFEHLDPDWFLYVCIPHTLLTAQIIWWNSSKPHIYICKNQGWQTPFMWPL